MFVFKGCTGSLSENRETAFSVSAPSASPVSSHAASVFAVPLMLLILRSTFTSRGEGTDQCGCPLPGTPHHDV